MEEGCECTKEGVEKGHKDRMRAPRELSVTVPLKIAAQC